jgi:hypothetical protein
LVDWNQSTNDLLNSLKLSWLIGFY